MPRGVNDQTVVLSSLSASRVGYVRTTPLLWLASDKSNAVYIPSYNSYTLLCESIAAPHLPSVSSCQTSPPRHVSARRRGETRIISETLRAANGLLLPRPYNSHSLAIPSAADGDAWPGLHRPPRDFELPRDSLSLLETEVSDACDLGDRCRDEQHADGHCGDEYLLLLQQHVVLVLLAGDASTTTTANQKVRAVSHTP